MPLAHTTGQQDRRPTTPEPSTDGGVSYLDQLRERERSLPILEAVDGRCCHPEGARHPWLITRALDRSRYNGFVQTPWVASAKAAAGMVKKRTVVMAMRFPVYAGIPDKACGRID